MAVSSVTYCNDYNTAVYNLGVGENYPIIDIRLFARPSYAAGVFYGFIGFFTIQGLMSLMSVQLQLLLGYSSSQAGDMYLIMMLAGLPLAGFMYEISKNLTLDL